MRVPNISIINGHFSGEPELAQYQIVPILDFIRAKDGGSGDNWNHKTAKLQSNRHH